MLKKKGTLRRVSAAFAVAVGIMAISGPGANAGALGMPEILNGKADSQALRIDLKLPSTDSLNAALTELGLGAAAVLPGGLLGNQFTQIVSLNHGEVLRSAKSSVADHASGFAAPLQGLLGGVDKVTSRCDGAGCGGTKASQGLEINVLDGVVPGGIGTIRVARADSITKSLVDTRNVSGLAEVELSLANLFAIEALKPLGDALGTLRTVINDTVLPVANESVIKPVADLVNGITAGTPLEGAVVLGPIKDIPDLTKVDLLDLEVLPAHANVHPFTPKTGPGKGVKGLKATSRAKVANLEILGNGDDAWASLGAIGLETSAFANGVKGAAKGDADVEILGADLGGLLGLSVPVDTLRDLTNGTAVKEVIKNLGLPVEQDLLALTDIIYNTAGITIDTFSKVVDVDPKGNFASATAGTIAITVEPKIPNLAKADLTSGLIPRLDKSDFVSTGLVLRVELPSAASAASIGKVLPKEFPPPPRTGVGTPLIASVVLIGAAAMVRRFALAK